MKQIKLDFGSKKLGFGFMRLPMVDGIFSPDGVVDEDTVCKMVDIFMENNFCYFDTAHGYVFGKSETAVRECLTKQYTRESYILTDKLSGGYFKTHEEIKPLCYKQLEACGVEYFDYYLMHALTTGEYEKYQKCNAFEAVKQLQEEGKIKHIGISFHDKPEVLEQILTEHPEIVVVQIQLNYVDYEDAGIQSRAVYDVCHKYEKPVIVMEPIKGGSLVNLPDDAKMVFDNLQGGSYASYAIRFAASCEDVVMVLSGMSDYNQMQDNISYMKDFQPLTEHEYEAVQEVTKILKKQDVIACTSCRYCVEGCPKKILIPDLFACMNSKKLFQDWNSDFYYGVNTSGEHGKASACIACRLCEKACPQHLPVSDLMKEVASVFEI